MGASTSFARACFFFQAEDGIRDGHVTGVQTCALPISVTQKIVEALPLAVINGEPIDQMMIFDNGKGLVEDPWGDSQIDIKPDETLDGTLYIEVDEALARQAQLYFFDNALLIYPDYAMKLNYNLDKKAD